VSQGTLSPAFDPGVTFYAVGPSLLEEQVTLTPTVQEAGATVLVDGLPTTSGAPSGPVTLPAGLGPVTVTVTAPDGVTQKGYTVLFLRGGPTEQTSYLKTSNPDAGDCDYLEYLGFAEIEHIGGSVAMSGDTLVFGVPFEDSAAVGVGGDPDDDSATDSGAVYVFVRSGESWSQQAYLKASNTGAGDNFGWSVAISGDSLVVGAPQESSDASGVDGDGANDDLTWSGAAYVFVRDGTTWTQQAYLKASNPDAYDAFGASVAVSGDTVCVGAFGEASTNGDPENDGGYQRGAAYAFVRVGGAWQQQGYLKPPVTGEADFFGGSVAVSADTIVVGAMGHDGTADDPESTEVSNSGSAYVFVRIAGVWGLQAHLKAPNAKDFTHFGTSVSISGDRLVVGAPQEGGLATGVNGDQLYAEEDNAPGAAYVFARTVDAWAFEAYLKSTDSQRGDDVFSMQFGQSVCISGSVVVVGAPFHSSDAVGVNGLEGGSGDGHAGRSGAAYVYVASGSEWTPTAQLKGPLSTPSLFGWAVAASGDTVAALGPVDLSSAAGVDGDPSSTAAPGSGAVHIFR
jgi:hypothetical protein